MTKHLITSALPYINGTKHLGNLVGSMLPADIYARYLRQKGEQVLFICGTDEHGTPAELAALKNNMAVGEYCEKMYQKQNEIYEKLGISFDYFGRTSSQQNKILTQHIANALYEKGYIYEGTVKQFYSIDDDLYLPDRYVEGECPHCGYENARGDQCENCTKLLDPEDLVKPRSAISGSENLELRESKHLFLSLKKMEGKLRTWIETKEEWSPLVKSIALKWLNEGLQDRCITRDLKWGVPVDRPGYEGKVYYVWFDAPIGYISITKEWSDQAPEERNWEDYWKDDKDVEYTQFMAKDNVPFHTISFPATLMAAEENWKLVDNLKGFNWLTYYGGKFSTSQGRGIFTDQALEIMPTDYWRYYLIARAPEGSDSSFTWEDFQQVCNKDLADVLGNFVNRLYKFSQKKYNGEVPNVSKWDEAENNLCQQLDKHLKAFDKHMSDREYRKSAQELRQIWSLGNVYIAEEAPWSNPDRMDIIIRTSFNLLGLIARLSNSFLPDTSFIIGKSLNIKSSESWTNAEEEIKNNKISTFKQLDDVLFRKIEDAEVESWKDKFGC